MSIGLDKKFIRKLHKRLVETEAAFFGSKSEIKIPIPTIGQLEEITLAVLWASTKQEEGKPLRFRVTYKEPHPIEHLALTFDFPPKSLNVEEIKKLAPAVPSPSGHIGIWSYKYFGLSIWGISTTNLIGISFEVVDPGRITICFPPNLRIAEKSGLITVYLKNKLEAALRLIVVINEEHRIGFRQHVQSDIDCNWSRASRKNMQF